MLSTSRPNLKSDGKGSKTENELLKPYSDKKLGASHVLKKDEEATKTDELGDILEKTAYRLLYVTGIDAADTVKLAALWIQATQGPCNTTRPAEGKGFEELAYWENWKELGEMTRVTKSLRFEAFNSRIRQTKCFLISNFLFLS